MMQILSRYDQFCKLWGLTFPSVPLPPSPTIMGWLAGFDDTAIQNVLSQALRYVVPSQAHEVVYKRVSRHLREFRDWQQQNQPVNQRTAC